MNLKPIKSYLLGLLIAFSASSCNDFLELTPISEDTVENGYNSAPQIEAALNGAYESFQTTDYYVWDNILLGDVRSDNFYAGGDNPEVFEYDLLTTSPTNGRVNKAWSEIYNAILKANVVLEYAPKVEDPKLSEERKNQILGEAYFLRAYHYFNLVRLYGGVPLVLEMTKSADPEKTNLPRASAEDVYAQIATDLQMAIDMLPERYESAMIDKARATKGAAAALAAKAEAQSPNRDYNKVLKYIETVENSAAAYKLIDFNHLFDGGHFNNEESIMEVQFIEGTDGNWEPQMNLPKSISGDDWRKFVTPSHDLINAYDAQGDDIRKNNTVLFEEVSWSDEYWFNTPNSSIPFAYRRKNASGWASADRQYILRYADVILLKAEAFNALGNISAAAAEINQVRARVNLPELTADDMSSKENMNAAILLERRLEFAHEGQRWYDLQRFGKLVSTMNNLVEIDLRTGKPTAYNMTEAKVLLPIPQNELDRNAALEQNPL